MSTSKSVRGALLAASLAPLLLISGSALAASPELIEAAKKEGEVVWYTSFPQNGPVRAVAAAFEKKYPQIKVRIAVSSPADTVAKITQEAQAGRPQSDVSHGTSTVGPLKRAGLVECYIPESAAKYPATLKDPDGCRVAQALYYYGISINTDLVKKDQEPKSAEDLLDPKWVGKLAWAAQQGPATAPGFIGIILNTMGEKAGMEYLQKLAKQKVVNVPANPRAVLDRVIAGDFPILLTSLNQHPLASAKDGAPVRFLGKGPIWGSLDAAFIVKGGPHPNAAKLFVDFSVSDEGQAAFRDAGSIPASPAVAAASPDLKPETGGYTATIFSLQYVDNNVNNWIKVFDQLFK